MNPLYIAFALLALALIVSLVHWYRTRNDGGYIKPQEQMIQIPESFNGLDAEFVVFDEAANLKPKQMTSRPRIKK
jgi:hypothetical protein